MYEYYVSNLAKRDTRVIRVIRVIYRAVSCRHPRAARRIHLRVTRVTRIIRVIRQISRRHIESGKIDIFKRMEDRIELLSLIYWVEREG